MTQVSDFVATDSAHQDARRNAHCQGRRSERQGSDRRREVVIGDAGQQEIRLRAGSHRVQAIKDGKAVRDQLVTITRGGKEIVNVDFEPADQNAGRSRFARPYLAQARMPTSACAVPTNGKREAMTHFAVGIILPDGLLRQDGHRTMASAGGQSTAGSEGQAKAQYAEAADRRHPERVRAMVWSLAFSPDGRRLAIAQQAIDRPPSILRIWDLAKRRDIVWFPHPVGYRSLAFSSDGQNLVAGNFDGTLSSFSICRRLEDPSQRKPGLADQFPGIPPQAARPWPPATGTAGSGSMVRTPWPTAVHSSIQARSGPSLSARMARRWRSAAKRTRSRFTTWRHGNSRPL